MTTSIAYISPVYPTVSETFVYREIAQLRKSGRTIVAVTLRTPTSNVPNVPPADMCVYRNKRHVAIDAVVEFVKHPLRGLRTIGCSLLDAFLPGNETSLRDRAIAPLQAFMALSLVHSLRSKSVCHIHSHFAHAPTTIAMYAAKQLDVTFSFTGHANDLFQRQSLLKKKCVRSKFVVAISHWHQSLYSQFISVEKCPVIRCGIDTSEWSPAENNEPNRARKIVTVARLVSKKGLDTLVEALSQVVVVVPDVQVEILGDGPQRESLVARACQLNLSCITWHGQVANETVREYVAGADLFVLPCRVDENGDKDGVPVVMMEAMACAVPVVAGDLPAIRELVQDQKTGRLVDGNSAMEVAAAIVSLLQNDRQRHKLGVAGRVWVQNEFDAKVNINRLIQAFDSDA